MKLPAEWDGVTTAVTFPVTFGAQVTIKCIDGYLKTSGDDIISCNGGSSYIYSSEPVCKQGKSPDKINNGIFKK